MAEQRNVVNVPIPGNPRFEKDTSLAISRLKASLMSPDAEPTFSNVALTDLTASQLVATDADKFMQSVSIGTGLDLSAQVLALQHLGLEDLTDPGGDRIFFWDDSENKSDWLGLGNSLSITTTTLDTIQDIRTSASPTFEGIHLDDSGDLRYRVDLSFSSLSSFYSFRTSNDFSSQALLFYRSRGDSDAAKSAVGDGDWAGKFQFYGYNGSSYDQYGGFLYDMYDVSDTEGKFVFYAFSGGANYIAEFGAEYSRLGDTDGTSYVEVSSTTGQVSLNGNARVKKNIQINASDYDAGGSDATDAQIGDYAGKQFGVGDDIKTTFELPEDMDTSADLNITIWWAIDEAYATNSGEVQWQIDWSACPNDETEALDSPTHTGTIDYGDQNIPATAKYLTASAAGTISAASLSAKDLVALNISRVALDDGSNPAAEPVIFHIDIEYTANTLGEAL